MEEMYFVKTTDEATANYLRQAGFTELPKEGSHWVFLNDSKLFANYSNDGLKVNLSNTLSI